MKRLLAVFLVAILLHQTCGRVFAAMTIPPGTKVLVKTDEIISSATQKKGDLVRLIVAADVMIDGRKVIAAGAPATAVVTNASKRFIAGIGGQLDVDVQSVQATDGSTVPVQYVKGEHSGSTLISVVLTVVCCICFVFIPGKDVSIDKGTIFEATVVAPSAVK